MGRKRGELPYLIADLHAIHTLLQNAVRAQADGKELRGNTMEIVRLLTR
jgi:hypothetical protein